MKEYCASVQEKIQRELARSGIGYLKAGLELFYRERNSTSPLIEPAIGNLAVAIELMIKAFLAKNNLILLFRDLPLELRILFTCPEKMSTDTLNLRHYDTELRSFTYKTFELNELISSFLILFPEHRQVLRPYFRLLSRCRNASIHLSLPSFQRYELERTAYLALYVYQILTDKEFSLYFYYHLTEQDKHFLSEYNEERIERVRRKIEEAKEKAKKIEAKNIWVSVDGWDAYETECAICGCGGMLTGETQVEADIDEDGTANPYLVFLADTFKCDGCGISLDDVEELQLAGMRISYDRSESDMDKWVAEMEPPDYEEY